ncbi:MAG: hypothetical protein HGA47_05780 [Zoogloea sp.]|nr:hypothetical protein [Zoogloea sp.]
MKLRCLALACLCVAGAARADAVVTICYNYGCAAEAHVRFTEKQLREVHAMLSAARSPQAERAALARAVGMLYRWAGKQSPIHADRRGDFLDGEEDGRMDCIDHAQSTHRLLELLEERGWLRFHAVGEIMRRTRWVVTQHFSATLEVLPEMTGAGERYVVDSWFVDHGEPAVVLPLEDWMNGEGPSVN